MMIVKKKIKELTYRLAYSKARRAFDLSVGSPYYLPSSKLECLLREYEHVIAKPFQDYRKEAMKQQASQRVDALECQLRGKPAKVLEVGPGAGYVLREFKRRGAKVAHSIDIVDKLYDEVKVEGVEITLVNDEALPPPPESGYDVVFSYGTMEHIPDPDRLFQECLNQVAPGGILSIEFGPLFFSPWGYHHQSILRCPYLHLLAPEGWVHELGKQKRGENYLDYLPWVNKLPLSSYRFLREPMPSGWIVEELFFGCDWYSMDVIRRFPGTFKAKAVPFDDFVIDTVRFVVRRLEL
jgi:SAM-dependent methyltransferase